MTTINIFIVSTQKVEEVAKYIEEHGEEIAKATEEALAAAEPEEEEEPIPELELIEDEDKSDGWDMECEDLLLDAEVAKDHWQHLSMEEAEAKAATIRAQEEANLVETERKEAEDDFKRKQEQAFKRIEEKKKKK